MSGMSNNKKSVLSKDIALTDNSEYEWPITVEGFISSDILMSNRLINRRLITKI